MLSENPSWHCPIAKEGACMIQLIAQLIAISSILLFTNSLLTSCGSPQGLNSRITAPAPTEAPPTEPQPYKNFRGQDFHGEMNFATLINQYLSGKVEPTPWAGYFYPYVENGIANGPALKYDAARGGTTDAQTWELHYHSRMVPRVEPWWGHCNGWCVASSLFPQPTQPVTVNGVTFGIGDIKALLTEAGGSVIADFYGERVWVDDYESPKFWDTVPDQYFLVLTNYIGKLKQPVLIDRYTGAQVWNQPLAAYAFDYPTPSDYLGNTPETPNVYRILVKSRLFWTDDRVPGDIVSEPFSFDNWEGYGYFIHRDLAMEVWLDGPVNFDSAGKITSSGNVIVTRQDGYIAGGAWRMGDGFDLEAWPDYMWIPYQVIKPTNPDQDDSNPHVDIDWITAHLLVPGGADDTTVEPLPYATPAPSSNPPSYPPSNPSSYPASYPSSYPNPTYSSSPSSPTSSYPTYPSYPSNPSYPAYPSYPSSPSNPFYPFYGSNSSSPRSQPAATSNSPANTAPQPHPSGNFWGSGGW